MPLNDDFDLMRSSLEQAAKLAVSSSITREERQSCENLFHEFRSSKSPYDFCKYLLETSKDSYVLFQSICALKEAIIREWCLISIEFVTQLENYLMNYLLTSHSTIDKFVQKAILQAIAVFYKRRILASKPNDSTPNKYLVQKIIDLFKSSDSPQLRQLCLQLMNALLNEFSNTSRSSNVGLTVNSHTNAKSIFEKREMKLLLIFIFEYVQHLLESNFTNMSKDYLMQLFSLIETCFTWEFTTSSNIFKLFIRKVDSNQSSSFKPSPEYKEIFLNPSLITLLFKSYETLRGDQELGHICVQSIIQLSTMSGPVFHDDQQAKHTHLRFFIKYFIECYSSSNQLQEYELLNYSSIMENLLLAYSLEDYNELNMDLIECLFQIISQFIINCFNAEKLYDHETKKYFESYEKILVAWTRFKELADGQLFKKYAQIVLDSFVQSRLTSVDESNLISGFSRNVSDNDSIDDEIEDDDLTRFNDVLFAISEFGRCIPEYSLHLLAKLLHEKFNDLTRYLTKISLEIDPNQTKILNGLYEDIHWLLLISGFLIFDMDTDLDSLIPNEIMSYSIQISSHINLSTMLDAYSNLSIFSSSAYLDDPIVSLIYNSLQLSELEIKMHESKMLRNASPQVASTLIWFLNKFSRSYLYMNERKYEQLSSTLQQLFGQDTPHAISIANFLLRKIYSNFYVWSSETSVTLKTAQLFCSLVKNQERCVCLFKNELFWSLSKICLETGMPWILLQSNVKKLIIKSLIISLSNDKNDELQMSFFTTIVQPLSHRFDTLFSSKKNPHVESVIKEVMSLIETFNGIIEGTTSNLIQKLFPFVLPRLEQSVQLLDIYHNYGEIVELILSMFNGIIDKYLFHLDKQASNQVYHTFLCLIEIFSRHNTRKLSYETNIEEDYFNDLLLFMTLLNTLQSKDLIQEMFDGKMVFNSSEHQHTIISTVDVVLKGLEFLIPLMSREMLKFQALCSEYFKLISYMSDSHPEKIFQTSFQLYSALIDSINYGLNSSSGTDIIRLCLECVVSLSNFIFTNNLQSSDYAQFIEKLFHSVFNMIFRSPLESDLFDIASHCIYVLICCFQDVYKELVNQLLQQFASKDDQLRETILNGFQALTPASFCFNLDKKNRLKFNEKFQQFCSDTYGLLFIK